MTLEEEFDRVVCRLGDLAIEKSKVTRELDEGLRRERLLKVFLLELAAGDHAEDPGERATLLLNELYAIPEADAPRPIEEVFAEEVRPIAAALSGCALAWEPGARLLGNITARQLGELASFVLAMGDHERRTHRAVAAKLEVFARDWEQRIAAGFYRNPKDADAATLRADTFRVAARRLRDGPVDEPSPAGPAT